MPDVECIPLLSDNYAYVIQDPQSGFVIVIDPGEPAPVLRLLKSRGLKLTHILNTHHHGDHVGGNQDLQAAYGCEVWAGEYDHQRIPGLTRSLADEEAVQLGSLRFQVLQVPGHTLGAVSYWFPQTAWVFTGDTLFSLGCGRLFEGDPSQMWSSLCRLRELPPQTRVYCGHEYTLNNALFVQSLGVPDADFEEFLRHKKAQRAQGRPTVPSLLKEECAFNPFMKADDADFIKALGLSANPAEAFAALRARKDVFR